MKIDTIVIHCSDSPHGRGDDAETIHRWHKARGFSGIGYHYVIVESGEVQHGRPEFWQGAHVQGHNTGSIGICLIGLGSFTPEQMQALRDLIREIRSRHSIKAIRGHREFDSRKTCPNFDVAAFVDSLGG